MTDDALSGLLVCCGLATLDVVQVVDGPPSRREGGGPHSS